MRVAPANASPARIELICIGTELLRGRLNTHQSHLALKLDEAGLAFAHASTLPDDIEAVADEISAALKRSDCVLVCGGLGPTFDDITREAAARALKIRLAYHPVLYAAIREKFAQYRIPFAEENKRQAYVLEGATILPNPHGSAPGQLLMINRGKARPQSLVLMPGPGAEMSPMFREHVLPKLQEFYAPDMHSARLVVHLSGLPESSADEKLAKISASAGPNLEFTILAGPGYVDYHATVRAASAKKAQAELAKARGQIYEAVGPYVFGEGEETLESAILGRLKAAKKKLAVAESCTGGLVAQRLTTVAGSSDSFLGGAVAYSNALKESLLGVPAELINRHGAVSKECAAAMAEGARRNFKAAIALSITGIAGPGGGTSDKPVGLVFIAIASGKKKSAVHQFRFSGNRETVRSRAAAAALHLLFKTLK